LIEEIKDTKMNYKKIALMYYKMFGFNVLPVVNKKPIINWDKWQNQKQTEGDLDNMNWDDSTGIGICLGLDDLRLLDFDSVENPKIIENIKDDLGIAKDYPWTTQSGSGVGFHLTFRVKENDLIKTKLGDKAVYKLKLKDSSYCDHIELRWKNCQTVFPPSQHENGGIYGFCNFDPKEMPLFVEAEKLVGVLEKYCLIETISPDIDKRELPSQWDGNNSEADNDIYFDEERLESALEFLAQNLPADCYDEWYRIGFGLASLGEKGENYFIDMSLKNPNYNDSEPILKKKFGELKKDYDGRITLGSIYHLAESYGWKKPIVKFWRRDDKKKLKISILRLKRFLEGEGFCKFRLENVQNAGSNYLYVRVVNNIVEEIDIVYLKDFIMEYLMEIPIDEFGDVNRSEVMEVLMRSNNLISEKQLLEYLIVKKIEFSRDERGTGYIYFQNGYVEIHKDRIKFNDYKNLKGHIWKQQMIKRDYHESNRRSHFEECLFNICRKETERFEALKSGIGYLLHTYKDPSIRKAIIFIDEKLSEGAYGASGKGLVLKSLGQIRRLIVEEGRNFSPSKNFAFQRVRADTNIIGFEDLRESFPFDKLFSIITDGIPVERKNKDEIYIGFNESPKVVITTNFSIKGIDDSTLDRQYIIEFSDYYNKSHRPIDDFGKLFFENSWNESEWIDFYCFMIECFQFYLKNGLTFYAHVNLERKKLIDMTSQDFAEFSEALELNSEYDKKEIWEKFKTEYTDYDKMSQGKFTKWLKIFAKLKDYEPKEHKSGAKRTIKFIKSNEKMAA
jgi:Bifunctional DNA primase/polymerase, N-terminal/Primase C terminal 2 (PriCT-2)